jgi:hypothetical protein
MKLLKILIFLILLMVLAGGYLGVIPGVSKLFGSDKPRDLGVKFTENDFKSMETKTGATAEPMPDSETVSLTIKHVGQHDVDATFTQEEFTSKVSNRKWRDNPFGNVQVKFNADGSAEASGILKLPVATRFFAAIGIATADVEAAAKKFNVPMADVPFYFKGTGVAENNHITPNLTALEIGRVPVPQSIINQYQQEAADLATDLLGRVQGFSMEKAEIVDGKLHFVGTLPDKEYYR